MSRHQNSVSKNSTPPSLPAQGYNQQPDDSSHPACLPQFHGGRHQGQQPITDHELNSYNISTRTNNPSSYQSQTTQAPTTPTTSYAPQQYPQQTSQYFYPQSNLSAPWTPAPTTSDVHNRKSRSGSASSFASIPSSVVSQRQLSFAYPEMLSRYLTVNPTESSLAFEDRRAISEGLVKEGEDMFARWIQEQGRIVQSLNGKSNWKGGQGESDGSRTLGRSRDEKDQ